MKKKSTWYWIIIFIFVLGGGGWFLLGRGNSKEVEYRFDEVKNGDISIVVPATGTLEAVTTVQVGSQVSGTIAKLYADYNTVVKAGEVVAQLDATFLQAQVKENEANLERAVAQMNDSKRIFERSNELITKGIISQAEFDATRTTFESQTATVKQSQAALDRVQVNLRYATIRAPIDGVVISRSVDVGQTVAASLSAPTLFIIANDLTKMQVQASIDEADIGRISLGQNVTFTVDAYPEEKFRGRVSEIRLQPNNVQNVINYTVIIDVPNNDLKLMPGMTANVTILIDRKQHVLRIPNLALRFIPHNISEEEKAHLSTKTDVREERSGTRRHGEESGDKSKRNSQQNNEKFSDGMTGNKGMRQGRDGKGSEFQPFDRQEILSSKNISGSGKAARQLTEKWKRSVSTYQRRETSGSVWIMNEKKKLKSISVRIGITDGMFTEIISGELKEGQKVVVGSIVKNDIPSAQSNPFGGQQQRPGGGRRQGM